jgi:hypothetical protein
MKLLVPQSVIFKTYNINNEGQKGAGVFKTYGSHADGHGEAFYGTARHLTLGQYRA